MRRNARNSIVMALGALALGACQDGQVRFAASPAIPTGMPVAFDSIEGAPPELRQELVTELAAAANARRVEVAGAAAPARYRLRGYLSTETGDDGSTRLAFVWDVFDTDKRRTRRVAGTSPLRGGPASNPWDGLDKDAMRRLAARSMDEIAVFLAARGSADAADASEPAPG